MHPQRTLHTVFSGVGCREVCRGKKLLALSQAASKSRTLFPTTMSVSDFGKATQSLQVSNLEVMGHGSSSTSGSIHASGNIQGRILPFTSAAVATTTPTAAECLGGIFTYPTNSALAFALPASLTLLNAVPRAKVGTTIQITIINTGNNTITVSAPGSNSVFGLATIATLTSGSYLIRFTAVGAAPTYIAYRM